MVRTGQIEEADMELFYDDGVFTDSGGDYGGFGGDEGRAESLAGSTPMDVGN